ncbi:MAG TPA: efflux transporter outer membrane subunit [Candidatus Mailhella merdavium]|nr:efflux transporter outer membrane subunit [Candidatus Mailhella merdavium]
MIKIMPLLAPALILALSGCSLAPEYQRPEMELPQTWDETSSIAIQTRWWERFHDETLNALVEEALARNKNIAQAMASVRQAQAALGVARDALLPVPSASLDGSRTMAREDMSPTALQHGGRNSNAFSGSLAASWTLDLWGKYWNASESARASLVATEAARDNVILTVAASTVESWFWLSAYTWQEEIAESVLKNREDSLTLYQNRFDNGQISEYDLLSIRANVETARNALASARIAKNAAETSLAVLLGRSPAEIMKMNNLKAPSSLMTSLPTTPALPADMPSRLLEQRPDIRQAEANLQAANYDIGVARAEFFPSFSLTGLLGTASPELNELFRGFNAYSMISGGLSLPLNFWTIKRGVDSAQAAKDSAIATYELTVLNAFKEVRDALVQQREYANSVMALTRQVEYLTKAVEHARTRYDSGFASYLDLLTSESNLFTAQQSLAAAHAQHLVSIAEVCLALGGGWQDGAFQPQPEDQTAQTPAAPAGTAQTPAEQDQTARAASSDAR